MRERYIPPPARSSCGSVLSRSRQSEGADQSLVPLPCDLPPGGRLELKLSCLFNSMQEEPDCAERDALLPPSGRPEWRALRAGRRDRARQRRQPSLKEESQA